MFSFDPSRNMCYLTHNRNYFSLLCCKCTENVWVILLATPWKDFIPDKSDYFGQKLRFWDFYQCFFFFFKNMYCKKQHVLLTNLTEWLSLLIDNNVFNSDSMVWQRCKPRLHKSSCWALRLFETEQLLPDRRRSSFAFLCYKHWDE